METSGELRINRKSKLIIPSELKTGFTHSIIPGYAAWMPLGQIGGVGGNTVGHKSLTDIILFRETEMLLRSYVAQHGGTEPADHGGTDT